MNEFWVDRSEDARSLADRVLSSTASIIIFYGDTGSGKTDLIRDAVCPLIPRASYRHAEFGDLEKASAGEFVFIDSFEELLLDPGSIGTQALTESLQMAQRRSFKFVLIVSQEYLNRLFQLQKDVPQLMEAAIELPPVSLERLFDAFLRVAGERDIRLSQALRDCLFSDLQSCSAKAMADPELFTILAAEFKKMQKPDREIARSDYDSSGGFVGILESHVESLFDSVSARFDPQMAWAVLETIAKSATGADDCDMKEVAARFDVAPEAPGQVMAWIEDSTDLVRKDKLGGKVIRPRQLSTVIQARRERDRDADEHLVLILRQGVRHFADTASCLSESSFRKLQSRRSTIRTSEDEAKLMLRCALAYEDAGTSQATEHWLRRLRNRDAAIEVLLDSTFDSRPETRQRAVARLCDFNKPEVRHQLHLLSLRDPEDIVRSQAIQSLNGMKDPALRNALLQEARDSNSPYRLQALEVLRIFNDEETIHTLVDIAQNEAAAGNSETRAKALQVLGRQDAAQPANALLKIALNDDNWTNRREAAAALALMKSEEPLRGVLGALCLLKPVARTGTTRVSVGYGLMTPLYAGMAAAVILLTFFVHGLLLATLGRWRLGIAITAIEVGSLALLGLDSFAGPGICLITLAIGLLAPTRIMLAGRHESRLHSRYRRWVDMILAAVDSVTFFLLVPGMAPLLTGHIRRGFLLVGVGASAVALITGAMLFQNQFASYVPLSRVFTFVPETMEILAALLFAIAYISGLVLTLLNSFLWPHRREWKERLEAVYSQLLSNPLACGIVSEKLISGKAGESIWAAALIRKHRRLFQSSIQKDSLLLLKTAASSTGSRIWLQYLYALWSVRVSLLAQCLVVFAIFGLLTITAFSAVAYELYMNVPGQLIKTAQNGNLTPEKRRTAIANLKILAEFNEPPPSALGALTKTVLNPNIDDSTREEARKAIHDVAQIRIGLQSEIIRDFATEMNSPQDDAAVRESAIAALQAIGVRQAASALQRFVQRPVPTEKGPHNLAGSTKGTDPELPLKLMAITAIQNMENLGRDAIDILSTIQGDTSLDDALRHAAGEAKKSNPLGLAEEAFANGQDPQAIPLARAALDKFAEGPSDPRAQRARTVLTTSNLRLGASALKMNNYKAAKAHFDEAMKYRTDDGASAVAAIDLGINLVLKAHEEIALTDSEAYQDTYQISQQLKSLETISPDSRIWIESNLAEAALTVGKFDETEQVAGRLLQESSLEPDMKINMHFMVVAARMFKGDEAGTAKARQDLVQFYDSLKAPFKNDWSYDGTRNYIRTSRLSPDQKSGLATLIDKIGMK